MAKLNKKFVLGSLFGILLGVGVFAGSQYAMKATSSTEFCVSCHSMEIPKQEWEGSVHFSNRKGVRAECANCHIPQDSAFHYVKTKVMALKDVWNTFVVDKLPDQDAYETHRLAMAKSVWAEMKASDSVTCKSCHNQEAMVLSEQSEAAQKMHKIAQETNQTCIDCHKGIVHFMPEMEVDNNEANSELAKHSGQFSTEDKTLYSLAMANATLQEGGTIRLMPYAELTDWNTADEQVKATLSGWQQEGAESVVYMDLGKRIMVALLENVAQEKIQVIRSVYDEVTAANWKEIRLPIVVPKSNLTADLTALNQFGKNLNETYCSGCHAPISADHYTANQWIGVVNSMKDRTSLSDEDVRTLTIYLQRNGKDMANLSH
ncbi:NapC/NirT family cytochrome c [Avibacterium sp. 21-595]|uniref:NapC/NirT family cytochrome c n=1 Tax=unclassified Avibacterium TaxID=2685287 RepID=UPI002025C2D8|nr:NapC/NirT family cytochrome c [Avibacterium sp. 21-595]URL02760.1 NapC/NirT family cytochrome c [Avibacterium sp. 20-126]URL05822.1 NapC/NirT family cytochrome c [Avibacterium sp. 21-595]